MPWFRRRKNDLPAQAGALDREQALNAVPVKNAEVGALRLDSGEMLLTYPIELRPWAAKLARRMGKSPQELKQRRLQLDILGTAVWDLIDGKRTVKAVVRQFSASQEVPIQEGEAAVTRFLRELGRRGLIAIR
jgi:hypothetical protein